MSWRLSRSERMAWCSLRIRVFAMSIVLGLGGCGDGSTSPAPSPAAFCARLVDLQYGRIDVDHENPNEFVGHVKSLEALIEVAPAEIRDDLRFVRDKLARARDAGGWSTLFDFAALQDPEIGNAEGRVTRFVARECGIQYGEPDWEMEPPGEAPPVCPAWPRVGSPLVRNRFPYVIATAAANYFSAQFWSVPFLPAPEGFLRVPRGGRVVFEGEYPYARYFALHPNDFETENYPTLRDVDLDPDPGSANPWRGPVEEGVGRRYTAQLVFTKPPRHPEPNTTYVGGAVKGGFNPTVFLIYRIYAADQGALPPNSAGVPLPAVTVYDAEGEVVSHFDACDPYPPGYVVPEERSRMPWFPVPDHRSVFSPGGLNAKGNWGLPVTLLSNKDVLYLSLFYTRTRGDVFVVRARKPRTPSRREDIPLYSRDVDIRLFTVCDYNFWNGRANDCVIDEAIPTDDDGFYTLVVSDRAHRPSNATREEGVQWLDWGPALDGQLTYRMLLSSDDLLVGIREIVEASDGSAVLPGSAPSVSGEARAEILPYVPRAAHCTRAEFEAGGWSRCFEASRARRVVNASSD